MRISIEYYNAFLSMIQLGALIANTVDNHGYFRTVLPSGEILFYPVNSCSDNHYSIGVTPGLEQNASHVMKDIQRNRILLVVVASNSEGDYVILEDESRYMELTGDINVDAVTYCHRVVKAILSVTNAAKSKGITPHEHITQLAD